MLHIRLMLQAEVRKIGKNPSVEDSLRLHEKRQRLQARIDSFEERGETVLLDSYEDTEEQLVPAEIGVWDNMPQSGDEEADEEALDGEEIPSEKQIIPLPSTRKITANSSDRVQTLVKKQLRLEEGHANDALHKIQLAIGYKSFLYRHRVRTAPNYDGRTRSGKSIRSTQAVVSHHADVYMASRRAMVVLGANEAVLRKYKVLTREDLKTDTAVANPNERGTRNERMSWIWALHEPDQESSSWMDECEPLFSFSLLKFI